MKERLTLREVAEYASIPLSILGLYAVSMMALTKKQREAILERDNHESQMRHYSEEQGWYTSGNDGTGLEVHHILPQRMGGEDVPENLITLNASEHSGRKAKPTDFVVHPDVPQARRDWHTKGQEAFQEMFANRDYTISQGEPYWNTDHDAEMRETAEERTVLAESKGWHFPWSKKKG